MRPELRLLTLFAFTAGGCAQAQEPVANQSNGATLMEAPASPAELAQRMVRQRLGNPADVGFGEAQIFASGGATIVCGRYQQAGRPPQRYVLIGEEDLFVEGEFVGDMNQAVAEACRNT